MNKIFWGYFFILFEFTIRINSSTIGLLPDFIGYLLILQGVTDLANQSNNFEKIKPFSLGMFVYTAIIYLMNLLGITATLPLFLTSLIGVIATVFSLYIAYLIIMGIKDIENRDSCFLNSDKLYTTWIIQAVLSLGIYVLIFVPILVAAAALGVFVCSICFLVFLYKSKNLYYLNHN